MINSIPYQISETAGSSIEDIYMFGLECFGKLQADIYQRKLEDTFKLLSDFPYAGSDCGEFGQGLRKFRSVRHYVFYETEQTHILIVDVLHTAANLNEHFLDRY